MFLKERSGLHEGHADVPPLEGGQQKVWTDFPESGRRPSLRPRGEEGPGGPDRRYALVTKHHTVSPRVEVQQPRVVQAAASKKQNTKSGPLCCRMCIGYVLQRVE